jgi:hypothetical protein
MYLLLQMILSCVSVTLAVFSLNVIGSDLQLPPRIRSFVFSRLSRLLCSAQRAKEITDGDDDDCPKHVNADGPGGLESKLEAAMREASNSSNEMELTLDAVLRKTVALLDYRAKTEEKQATLEKIRRERYALVSITDRLLFIVSAALLLLISFICFQLLMAKEQFDPSTVD